jgi:Tfp pilus assembly protein PilN
MRLDINLASQPYEDARQFWLRWGSALAIAAVITLGLVIVAALGWKDASKDRLIMANQHREIDELDRKRAQAEKTLNLPENRATRDASQLLNELIERKAFSWTRVFEDMEKVMPPRVHLVSISPELDPDNQLSLKMVVAGNSRDRAIELTHRMEDSHRFAQTNVLSETTIQATNGDTESFDITAIYIPEPFIAQAQAPPPPAANAKNSAKEKKP